MTVLENGTLTAGALRAAVRDAQAVRLNLRLEPAGGRHEHVYPPTYPGEGRDSKPRHAVEERWVNGEKVPCVVLDSVQSQANRLELALLQALRAGDIRVPHLSVSLPGGDGTVRAYTSLELSHRAADAVFRDSLLDGEPFQTSPLGRRLQQGDADATALFETDPASLLHGVWWSTQLKGRASVRLTRALTSSITGINFVPGLKPTSRLDALGIVRQIPIRLIDDGADWELGEPPGKGAGRKEKATRPSEINHGNVTPSLLPLGGAIDHARQTAVLSFVRLRQIRFPNGAGAADAERDAAARAVLAALALVELTAQAHQGYDLRAGCFLVPVPPAESEAADQPHGFELLTPAGAEPFALDYPAATALLADAVAAAAAAGLSWRGEPTVLTPTAKLADLKRISDRLGGQGDDEAE